MMVAMFFIVHFSNVAVKYDDAFNYTFEKYMLLKTYD